MECMLEASLGFTVKKEIKKRRRWRRGREREKKVEVWFTLGDVAKSRFGSQQDLTALKSWAFALHQEKAGTI